MKDEIKQNHLGVTHMGTRGPTDRKCHQNQIHPPSDSILDLLTQQGRCQVITWEVIKIILRAYDQNLTEFGSQTQQN